jgi:DNA invertase Pin-like site-specific DNA recombinase
MVIKWDQQQKDKAAGTPGPKRAAQYVRMSTEHQQYSTDNQSEAILRYAAARGFEIVATYADEGKSGLNIGGRVELQRLLADIERGNPGFEAVLVYDVSRWGRFQDPDEAASYELACKRAGVALHYCAEQFENDGSIGSSIIKTVKRAMAGEYSRELSVKVFAGQSNLIRLGYRQGGPAGFGLRRMLVDQEGKTKGELGFGEHKSIQTDRVILVPGPSEELDVVREIYKRFLAGETEQEIATDLHRRDLSPGQGRGWTRGSIHQILINEKYIGNNVWGRTSFKLKQERRRNAPEDWIKCEGAFEQVIDPETFGRAGAIIRARSQRLGNDEMLALLANILQQNGRLSGLIIDECTDTPSSGCYRSRFGSLLRAYALVGFEPEQDYRYLETNRAIRGMLPEFIQNIMSAAGHLDVPVRHDDATGLLSIAEEVTLSPVIARCFSTPAGSLRWKIRLNNGYRADFTLVARMEDGNDKPRDYYLLPALDLREAMLRLCEYNGLSFDAYRRETLDDCLGHFCRSALRRAA